MSVLLNNPTILAAVISGIAFLIALKVTAFLVVRKVMRKPPNPS